MIQANPQQSQLQSAILWNTELVSASLVTIEESFLPDPLSGNPSVNDVEAPTSLPQRIQVFFFNLIAFSQPCNQFVSILFYLCCFIHSKRVFVKLNTLEPADVLNFAQMCPSFFIYFSPSVIEKISLFFLPSSLNIRGKN